MPHSIKNTSKTRNTQKKRSKVIWKARVKNSLPDCNDLSQFQINDENIQSFRRYINSPMDCVINALQLMGLLDTVTSNLFRISCVGTNGFEKDQIEKIFILYKGVNFEFKSTTNFNEFLNLIETKLLPGNVVFAGYTGHVFIIGRLLNGNIMYIDPQINKFCDIKTCQNLIMHESKSYYLLFNSEKKLTIDQLNIIGFVV